MSKYNFEENILEISETNDIKNLPLEWEYVCGGTKNGHCICNRKIKNISYFFNFKTGHSVMCGSGCMRKLKLRKKRTGAGKFIKNIFGESGEYVEIKNFEIYSDSALDKILIIIENKINFDNLQELVCISKKLRKINNMKFKELYDYIIFCKWNILIKSRTEKREIIFKKWYNLIDQIIKNIRLEKNRKNKQILIDQNIKFNKQILIDREREFKPEKERKKKLETKEIVKYEPIFYFYLDMPRSKSKKIYNTKTKTFI